MDDDLLHDFLDELAAMRAFMARRRQTASVDGTDPDVLRLVEALAFFTVHTRRTAARNLETAWRRLLAQDFGYLLAPLPASGLVRATGASALFPAARTLPRGAAIQLKARSSKGMFSTTRELGDLRNVLSSVTELGRSRLELAFEPGQPRRDAPGTISLFVSPREDYAVSLALLEQIRRGVRGVRASYTTAAGVAPIETPCALETGAFAADETLHPLARLRSFFHDPRHELFLHLTPAPPPGVWTRLTIVLDFDPMFDLSQVAAALSSHVLPIVNKRRAFARPIRFTAVRTAEPVVPLEAEPGTDVLAILGAYQTRGHDLVPLRSGALGLGARTTGVGGGWEPERGDDGRTFVTLRDPEGFTLPGTVNVEALWHQPGWVDEAWGQPIDACLPDRHVEGIGWQLVGALYRDDSSAPRRTTSEVFELLGLRSRPALGLDDLLLLLDWIVPASSVYRDQIPRIRGLDSEIAMDLGPRGNGIARRYTLTFAPAGRDDALGAVFLGKVRDLLVAWSTDAGVTFAALSGGVPMALPAA